MTHVSRVFVAFAALVVGIGSWSHTADAQVKLKALGGIRGLAAAGGVKVLYNPKGLLPTGPPVDLTAPDALATISTGPLTFARAGVADPGDLLANPEALLTQASPDYPAGTVPSWPLRITASSSLGNPSAESNPAPGMRASVEALKDSAHAVASMPGTELPAIAAFGSVVSEAWTKTDGASVVSRARSRISGFNLLGVVVIDSIVSDLTATSDAVTAKLEGATTVVGATVAGRKVTIDSDGVHARSKNAPDLNALLTRAGIKITLADPSSAKSGSSGQRDVGGLRIDLVFSTASYPALSSLLDMLPPLEPVAPGAPGVEDLIAVARARHTSVIQLGSASVQVDARRSAIFSAPVVGIDDDEIVPSLVSGFDTLSPTPLSPGVALPPVTNTPTAIRSVATSVPLGSGVGGLLLLVLLAMPLLGWRLAVASSSMLSQGAGIYCPEEDL